MKLHHKSKYSSFFYWYMLVTHPWKTSENDSVKTTTWNTMHHTLYALLLMSMRVMGVKLHLCLSVCVCLWKTLFVHTTEPGSNYNHQTCHRDSGFIWVLATHLILSKGQRSRSQGHSLTHCCAWPAEGRSVLHMEQSWLAIWAAPTDRPMSSSTCCSHVLRSWTTRRTLTVSGRRSARVGFYWQLQCLQSRCVLRQATDVTK